MYLDHSKTRTILKEPRIIATKHHKIFASIGHDTFHTDPEISVIIHDIEGLTIDLDRDEALTLLAFLEQYKQTLLDAPATDAEVW